MVISDVAARERLFGRAFSKWYIYKAGREWMAIPPSRLTVRGAPCLRRDRFEDAVSDMLAIERISRG